MNAAVELSERLGLDESQRTLSFAIGLHLAGHISAGKAAELCGMDRFEFRSLLATHGVPISYGMEEYQQDLKTVAWLEGR